MKCKGSLNDTYSRRGYQPCDNEAVTQVSLYGKGFHKGEQSTPMCASCAERTQKMWNSVVVQELV